VFNLFARPLRGGKILVDRVIEGAAATHVFSKTDESYRPYHGNRTTHLDRNSKKVMPRSATLVSTNDSSNGLIDGGESFNLTTKEILLESSFLMASNALKLWKKIDANGKLDLDGDNQLFSFFPTVINIDELETILSTACSGLEKFQLSFAEFAWLIASSIKIPVP
jgi:hypothetical protein